MGRSRSQPGRKKPSRRQDGSLLIPIVVGLVVLAVIAGLLLSLGSRRPESAALSPDTALPLATSQIPYPGVPRISVEDTQAGIEAGRVLLVDVRSAQSYNTLHAAGALSLPEDQVDARLAELPRDKQIVLYCT